jgi:hypothetical protein
MANMTNDRRYIFSAANLPERQWHVLAILRSYWNTHYPRRLESSKFRILGNGALGVATACASRRLWSQWRQVLFRNTTNLLSIKVATCFDSRSHHQANYRTTFEIHQVKVQIFGIPKCLRHSNKSNNQIHQPLRFIGRHLDTTQHVSDICLSIIRSL